MRVENLRFQRVGTVRSEGVWCLCLLFSSVVWLELLLVFVCFLVSNSWDFLFFSASEDEFFFCFYFFSIFCYCARFLNLFVAKWFPMRIDVMVFSDWVFEEISCVLLLFIVIIFVKCWFVCVIWFVWFFDVVLRTQVSHQNQDKADLRKWSVRFWWAFCVVWRSVLRWGNK